MSDAIYTAVFFAAVFTPLIVFATVALFASASNDVCAASDSARDKTDEVLLSSREVRLPGFLDSSVAYMLQVSTTFYFVYWGYHYGFANIFYLASWAIGLILFARFATSLYAIRTKFETLPAFLSDGRGGYLRILSSVATIISFLGVFYVEAYFCADFVSTLTPLHNPEYGGEVWWIFFLALVILAMIYSALGGLRKVIATDKWQLAFAYFGMAAVFCYLMPKAIAATGPTGWVVSGIALALYVVLFASDSSGKLSVKRASLGLSVALMLVTLAMQGSYFELSTNISIPSITSQIAEPWGWVTLTGFTLLNFLWQFCDNSNYQRIAALDLDADPDTAARQIKSAILKLTVVSPVTWGLGIILGMLIRATGMAPETPGSEYVTLLEFIKTLSLSGDYFAFLALISLAVALISIMLSTADSAIICGLQTVVRDLRRKPINGIAFQITVAAFGLFIVVAVGLIHRNFSAASILTVMAGVYSSLVVLSWPTLLKLLKIRLSDASVGLGIILGISLTWLCTFGPTESLPWNVAIVLPFFGAIIGPLIPIGSMAVFRIWQK